MSSLFAWIPTDKERPTETVVAGMATALRCRVEERSVVWNETGLGIGLIERPFEPEREARSTASSPARVEGFSLWMAGEVFYAARIDVVSPDASRSLAFRQQLLNDILEHGLEDVARGLDGEFWIALWDARVQALRIANDRLGGLPLYVSESPEGVAVAGGVRGVLMAPGVDASADVVAIRESVTFGGFRLGGRTNVRSVRMLPGGCVATLSRGAMREKRYWSFADIPETRERNVNELLETAETLWSRAVSRRIVGSERFGQTLSGGLDSRAIMAEAAPQKPTWATLTYGVPECDDVRYAQQAAAEVSGVAWRYANIYRDPVPDWLTSRSRHIQRTDGMIDLFDLMHVDSVSLQAEQMDTHVSGYIGDAVCGPTFAAVQTTDDVMASLPYYGDWAMTDEAARNHVEQAVGRLRGAPLRYALFENKLPQATNRWAAAWRPWVAVRKPFVDYELFDFWQGLPVSYRLETSLYERLLVKLYPRLFEAIPNQRTGVPVLTPPWRYQLTRAARFGWRRCRALVGAKPRARNYHDAHTEWAKPAMRERITETILREGSVSADALGREKLTAFLNGWFDRAEGPTQIVATLYVYEHYHRDLGSHLRHAT